MDSSDDERSYSETKKHEHYQADINGDVSGQVVIGNHNLVVRAQGGSTVNVRTGEPPKVQRRRPPDAGAPRSGPVPLGREREIATVTQALNDGLPVQIYGGPGTGRSTLLRHVARMYANNRDVIFLSAAGLPVDDLLQVLFDACFESGSYRPEPLRMRRLMGPVNALLVVDDFTGSPDDLATLLDAAPSCDVLVASADRSLWSAGHALELGGIPDTAGTALLARELGRPLAESETPDALELWRAAAGNPLALVQAAAAVRSGAGVLATFRDSDEVAAALAQRLTDQERRVLGVLHTLAGAPVSEALLAVLTGADCNSAVVALEQAGLIVNSPLRLTNRLAEQVAASIGIATPATGMANAVVTWLSAGTDRRTLGEAAAAIVQVLRVTVAAGEYRSAVALARLASPRFARAMRIGAWGKLLELGRSAAQAGKATADEAYFAHESAARFASLGKGAAAGALFGVAAALWRRFGDNHAADASQQAANAITPGSSPTSVPPQLSVQPPPGHGVGHAVRTVAGKPAVWAFVVTAGVAGTIALASGGDKPINKADSDIAGTTTISPTTTFVAPTSTSPEETTATTTSRSRVTSSSTIELQITTIPNVGCVPEGGAEEFGPVEIGDKPSRNYTFHADPCHPNGLDTAHMRIQGKDSQAFQFVPVSCQAVTKNDLEDSPECIIKITFQPPSAGEFRAEIFIPEAGPVNGQHGYGLIPLHGVANPAAPATSTTTTSHKLTVSVSASTSR
jgi:hypothetical protein